jgi:hypothetical protein
MPKDINLTCSLRPIRYHYAIITQLVRIDSVMLQRRITVRASKQPLRWNYETRKIFVFFESEPILDLIGDGEMNYVKAGFSAARISRTTSSKVSGSTGLSRNLFIFRSRQVFWMVLSL